MTINPLREPMMADGPAPRPDLLRYHMGAAHWRQGGEFIDGTVERPMLAGTPIQMPGLGAIFLTALILSGILLMKLADHMWPEILRWLT